MFWIKLYLEADLVISAAGCPRQERNGLCQINDKKLKHGCSKLEANGRICWKRHKESEHQ